MIRLSSLLSPQALAVGVPCLLCTVALAQGTWRALNRTLIIALVGSTLESVLLSSWQQDSDQLSLHIFNACALLLVMMPKGMRPTWQLGYCLVFACQLATDLICTTLYGAQAGCLSSAFFCGVGGAGLFDALLITPLWAAAVLAALAWLERQSWARRPLLGRVDPVVSIRIISNT